MAPMAPMGSLGSPGAPEVQSGAVARWLPPRSPRKREPRETSLFGGLPYPLAQYGKVLNNVVSLFDRNQIAPTRQTGLERQLIYSTLTRRSERI
jgi:hypothetical protein